MITLKSQEINNSSLKTIRYVVGPSSSSRSYQRLEVTDKQPTSIVNGAAVLDSGLRSAFVSTE